MGSSKAAGWETRPIRLLPHKLRNGEAFDTPGLKEFGLWDINSEELQSAFPEIRDKLGNCHFSNCSHVHEPKCGVRNAVEDGLINRGRYRSYCQLLEEIE